MKKLLLLILVISPLLSFGQTKKMLRKAIRTTDLNERIKLLNQIIETEPKNLDAYFYRAVAKNNLGNYRSAIVDYSKIIVDDPDADTYFNRGNSRYSIKDLHGAREDYAKAYMLDSTFIDALYSLACVKLDLGEYKPAIKDFTTITKEAPGNPNTFVLRATAYKGIENFKDALSDYSTAILLEPNANNYYNRGAFLMELKYYKDARTDLTRALRINKNNAFAYFYRGASHLFTDDPKRAISDFSEAIKYDAMDFDAYLGLAMAQLKMNDTKNAKLNFDRANAIIIPGEKASSIEQYNNTYWFQEQYFYFNNTLTALAKL